MPAPETRPLNIGLCVRHEQVVRNTTPYLLGGRVHVYYGLKALRDSGVADRLFFYSRFEPEIKAAEELGYTILRLEERDWSDTHFPPFLNRRLALEMGMDSEDPNPFVSLLSSMDSLIRMDCNLVLLRAGTIREMHRLSNEGRERVYAAAPLEQEVMLGLPEGRMFTVMKDWTQGHYLKEHKPNLMRFFIEARVETPRHKVPGALGHHYLTLPEDQRLYLEGPMDAALADAWLSAHPDHFD